MKIKIEIDQDLNEAEVIIRGQQIDEEIQSVQKVLTQLTHKSPKLTFVKDDKEFFFALKEILFFETENNTTYAHTRDEIFKVKYRIYELEELLTSDFVRISKSAIVNIQPIYAITRYIGTPNTIQFNQSHKQISVSRQYFKQLRERLASRN